MLRFDAENCTQAGPELELNIHAGTVRDLTFVSKSSGSPVLVSGGAGNHFRLHLCQMLLFYMYS